VRHFPSPDIGMFGRRLRDVRGHRTPVEIVAGGKVPSEPGTIVVVDEFEKDEAPLGGGCACCTVRVRLQDKLRQLLAERARGAVQFSRVVISIHCDPASILRTFATEAALGGEFFLERDPDIADATRFTFTEAQPLDWRAFSHFIASLIALRGKDLLRTDGLLNIDGCRGPVVVRYRQHLSLQPVELEAWPAGERASQITFATRDVPEKIVRNLFGAVRAIA
jgi:G3E family GTPase